MRLLEAAGQRDLNLRVDGLVSLGAIRVALSPGSPADPDYEAFAEASQVSHWWGWIGLAAIAACSLLSARMAMCNAGHFFRALRMPPLQLGGEFGNSSTPPWEKRWQRWLNPKDLDSANARRYADLAASKANGRRVAAELLSVLAAAAVGALLPSFVNPDSGGISIGLAMGTSLAAVGGGYWLRQRAGVWEVVADTYDDQAEQLDAAEQAELVRRRVLRRRALVIRRARLRGMTRTEPPELRATNPSVSSLHGTAGRDGLRLAAD